MHITISEQLVNITELKQGENEKTSIYHNLFNKNK